MTTPVLRLVSTDPSLRIPDVPLLASEITIGRSRQSNLHLDDPSVSRVHARVRRTEDGYTIADAGSLHGTLVNGKAVVSHRLAPNDVIQVGVYRLQFVDLGDTRPQEVTLVQNQVDHLRLLLTVTQYISSSLAIDEVLEHVIDGVIQVTHAERGFLMMLNASGDLEFRVARNFDHTALATDSITTSSSIISRVRSTGMPVVLSDTLDADVSGSIVELGLLSVMCVPLKIQSRLLGLIYVDSRQKAKRFSDTDLELFESLASQAALAIEKSQLYEELHRYSTSLEELVRQRTAELLQAEKMAAVGRLAAGIAHEINSPLGVIASNVDMLSHLAGPTAPPPDIIEGITATFTAASTRLRRIIKAFQALTGLDQAELMQVNLDDVIDEVLALLERDFQDRIEIVRTRGALRRVRCSPSRMAQAFMNILTNASESIDKKGTVHVRSEQIDEHVRITIRDSGRGMTPEQLATVFDAGFNKREGRVSASMGLMITSQIVRDHRGDIRIESNPGSGTIVVVTVPNLPETK